ncbi:hypothetical protein [Candidatus Allofournierella merdipullorum]|uniref:hypothetical protein n=1 Tax=Candidatus Allofournierella merdipullorum TaxID=2838595 RepID=UPI00374F9D69
MAKKPKTIQQLGNEILEELEKRKALPDILESYGSNTVGRESQEEIYDIEFDVTATVSFGSCEGIFVCAYADGYFAKNPEERKRILLFTAKTLDVSQTAAETMGQLAGRCVFVGGEYIEAHKNELVRRGYQCQESADSKWALIVPTKERALEYKAKGHLVFDLYEQKYL